MIRWIFPIHHVMVYSIRYLLAVDQYLPVAPLWAVGDVHPIYTVSLHEVWTLHLPSPAWLSPFFFWCILFKKLAGFVGLAFCYCNSESPAQPIYMNTFSNWHASTFCVWFAKQPWICTHGPWSDIPGKWAEVLS